MELCAGSLMDVVPLAKARGLPGLPAIDLVSLGLMLCSSLFAVHHTARCLHLDITPANVLLGSPGISSLQSQQLQGSSSGNRNNMSGSNPGDTGSQSKSGEGGLLRVRLADFGLSKRMPTCVRTSLVTAAARATRKTSLVHDVAGGTPGYAPKEQLGGKGQRRSDIYSLGATLVFAATGSHPFEGCSLQEIVFKVLSGAFSGSCFGGPCLPVRICQ